MKLLISLSTRNRPQKLLETIRISMANWTHPNTTLTIHADADDYATLGMVTDTKLDPRIKVNVQKREDTIAAKWNRSMSEPADVYAIAADDDPVITPGYDTKILEAAKLFPDGIGMVYGHMSNVSFSSIMCPTRRWVEVLGYIVPEYFPYWFCDHWIDDIGRMTNRIVHADIRSDQRAVGTTQEMREPAWWGTWFDAAKLIRRADADKLIAALDETEMTKARLRTLYMRVEHYSKWVNDNVRQNSRGWELTLTQSSNDERYRRVRDAAVALMPKMFEGMDPAEAKMFSEALAPPSTIVSFPRAFG
jgi:hypothetical protein